MFQISARLLVFLTFLTTLIPQKSSAAQATSIKVQASYGNLPLAFEPNQGQTVAGVEFLARGMGYNLFIEPARATLVMSQKAKATAVLHMSVVGGNRGAAVLGVEELAGKSNYFIGKNHENWQTEIPNYRRVKVTEIYPGIDMVYYGNQGRLEFDFVVRPRADPTMIELNFDGIRKAELGQRGELILHIGQDELILQAPVIYQGNVTMQKNVGGCYVMLGQGRIGFEVQDYDRNKDLIIDPVIMYSTYLGGSWSERGFDIAVDAVGNAYVTGVAGSPDFPIVSQIPGISGLWSMAFVTKIDATGSSLVYSTYIGGSNGDVGFGIAVDSSGNAYITGRTQSSDFPMVSAIQPISASINEAFVTKINAAGSALVYSTYLGGSNLDEGYDIAVDSGGSAYVTGRTFSVDFPLAFPIQSTISSGLTEDVFITKINSAGSALVYSTYLGGVNRDWGYGIAVDSTGNVYATGHTSSTDFPLVNPIQPSLAGSSDVYVTKINPAGSAIIYSTYLGGSDYDRGYDIAVDNLGNAYVTGDTESTNYPLINPIQSSLAGGYDAFVTKINSTGTALDYSTYIGGTGYENGRGIAVDSIGNAYLTGWTGSSNFPTFNAFQGSMAGSFAAIVVKINTTGSAFVYSSFLGGFGGDEGRGIAVDTMGNAYVTGVTDSGNFPLVNPFQGTIGGDYDVFITKISDPSPTPSPSITTTPTWTATLTISDTLTYSETSSPTYTHTPTPTYSPTWTTTPTSTWTPSFTKTYTKSNTLTFTPTWTFTPTPSVTFTWSGTITYSGTITPTNTRTLTFTPTPTYEDDAFILDRNAFNPDNGEKVNIIAAAAVGGRYVLMVYNTAGEIIRHLSQKELAETGVIRVDWDGRNDQGNIVASGIYLIHVEAPKFARARRIAVIR